MANGHGGYRKPTNPAPVSGPGALSRRTDGAQPMMQLPNAGYGEQAQFQAAQAAGPLAQVQQGAPAPGGPSAAPQDPLAALTPMGAPTTQPGVPVTAGAASGPGPGPEALDTPNTSTPGDTDRADAQALKKFLPIMLRHANSPNATPGFRAYVRQIIANS